MTHYGQWATCSQQLSRKTSPHRLWDLPGTKYILKHLLIFLCWHRTVASSSVILVRGCDCKMSFSWHSVAGNMVKKSSFDCCLDLIHLANKLRTVTMPSLYKFSWLIFPINIITKVSVNTLFAVSLSITCYRVRAVSMQLSSMFAQCESSCCLFLFIQTSGRSGLLFGKMTTCSLRLVWPLLHES